MGYRRLCCIVYGCFLVRLLCWFGLVGVGCFFVCLVLGCCSIIVGR